MKIHTTVFELYPDLNNDPHPDGSLWKMNLFVTVIMKVNTDFYSNNLSVMRKQPKIIQIWLLIHIQLTSHICSWKNLLSFSISSAISAPLISVLIIPCCLACSFFSFSILVLPGNYITGVKDHKHIHDKTKQNKMCHLCEISLTAVSITRTEGFSGLFWLSIYG